MSKKRRWRPVVGVEVEEPRAPLRVGPVRVRVVGRHVVRDDVEHDAQPRRARGGGQRAEALLAAERVREPRRVDHVVAVRRARARRERRREVQVRDAELAQVGDERGGVRERHPLAELEAVGRAERRHVSRPAAAAPASARRHVELPPARRRSASPAPRRGRRCRTRASSCAPKRRLGRREARVVPGEALKSSRNESSSTRSPSGPGAVIPSPLRNSPSRCAPALQSCCVIRRPSGRNHHASGRPEPVAVLAGEEVAPVEDGMRPAQRDQPLA